MERFVNKAAHRAYLSSFGNLPSGFRISASPLKFSPKEVPGLECVMRQSLISLDSPSNSFAGVFTRNTFPGAPVIIGRERMKEEYISAITINNKVSNVCPKGGGVVDAELICSAISKEMNLPSPKSILPCSTGVIGWRLPVTEMLANTTALVSNLKVSNGLNLAESIMTTDLYPKLRSRTLSNGSVILGVAKGAGMVEPNMATMLVYILTDADIPRKVLREMLPTAVDSSFNQISVDSDTSTSDTVFAISSCVKPLPESEYPTFAKLLGEVCSDLAEDVVRNGEGVQHVISVNVNQCPSTTIARGIGKSIVNSPLLKAAIAGNDANVGRILMAIGKYLGNTEYKDMSKVEIFIGGQCIFSKGEFTLEEGMEAFLKSHLVNAQMYSSSLKNGSYLPPNDFPVHREVVDIEIRMGLGTHFAKTLGGDLTYEYISENADYRS